MRARILLVPLVAAAALLAGCTTATPPVAPTPTTNGLEALSADEILTKATAALEEAKSFKVSGKGAMEGQTVEIDLTFAGDDLEGSITMDGMAIDAVLVGDAAYMKAEEDFWKLFLPAEVQPLALPLIAGKYVKLPASQLPLPKAGDLLKPEGSVTKGAVTTVAGKPAIELTSEGGKLNVSLIGKPYPISLVGDEGTIEFTDFDAAVTIEAPPAAEVFDLSAFTG
jgi:hypothetical protein